MTEIRVTRSFSKWFDKLRDLKAKANIAARIARLQDSGSPGDAKSVGGGVFEMRVNYGPGYRVYYAPLKSAIILLLVGGDKSTQERDIASAKRLYRRLTLEKRES